MIFCIHVRCSYLKVSKTALVILNPLLKRLEEAKEESHVVSGHALIIFLPGCQKQVDGKVDGKTMPYTCLLALEDNSAVYIEGKK